MNKKTFMSFVGVAFATALIAPGPVAATPSYAPVIMTDDSSYVFQTIELKISQPQP